MSPTLLQFVAIFASNLQIQSTPSLLPLHSSLHSVVAASIAAAFWTKDSCKWLVKSQHSNAPRTGRGRPLPLRRHIDKKVQIKEGNGLQKRKEPKQSKAKRSEVSENKTEKSFGFGLGFLAVFPSLSLSLSLSLSFCCVLFFIFLLPLPKSALYLRFVDFIAQLCLQFCLNFITRSQ